MIPGRSLMEAQAISVVCRGKAFTSQSDDGGNALQSIEKAADRVKEIAEIENANHEIKAILESGVDNLYVEGHKPAILGWERHEIRDKTKLNHENRHQATRS
jgi:hypothetical protein